uniref:DUF1273 family protein n=1 Tax=Steinernema glaseri TaxID=37863 RepID=A0A1I7Y2G3_9BILA
MTKNIIRITASCTKRHLGILSIALNEERSRLKANISQGEPSSVYMSHTCQLSIYAVGKGETLEKVVRSRRRHDLLSYFIACLPL